MLKGILLAIFCSILSLIIHLIITFFRKGRRVDEPVICELKRQSKLIFFIWLFTFLIYTLMFFQTPDKIRIVIEKINLTTKVAGFIYGLVFYSSLSLVYLCVYYFIDRSVSATILEIIHNSLKKKLTINEIKMAYPAERKYQMELKGMLEGRFIIEDHNYYRNSFKGSLYAKIAKLTKRLLKLGPGG